MIIPEGYKSQLNLIETEKAIKYTKDIFQTIFAEKLGLDRISAPLFVCSDDGINDDLNGIERAVEFDIKAIDKNVQIVQSLAKWKRFTLYKLGFTAGQGLYTDMNAIRRDEDSLDNFHSVYVDQWDWEKVILKSDRNIEFLKDIVCKIVDTIYETKEKIKNEFHQIDGEITKEVFFISSQELEDMYPNLSSKEREREITKKYKTVFIIGIGGVLKSGVAHDGRAPDYDDWALNGDIILWDDVLNEPMEISSMGIRVDEKSLLSQLETRGQMYRLKYNFHKMLKAGLLPLTIGGGIGQSRLCMLLLNKCHIGEVAASVWADKDIAILEEKGIHLL